VYEVRREADLFEVPIKRPRLGRGELENAD
jgi:hypothetical protein